MKFKYKDRIYNPSNLEKKLKKLGITINDVEIIPENKPIVEMDDTVKYYFKNKKTGYTITSIYNNLDNLKDILDIDDYEKCEG